ncbi:MAG: tetratricopeptide repeat protein [Deltaproteobacteria bacterium]|nr:tetratricopeptide repeat protein [Deltaproteobacteria bacterium]
MRWGCVLALVSLGLAACSGRRARQVPAPDGGSGQVVASGGDGGARGVSDADKAEARAANLRGDRLAAEERWPEAVAAYDEAIARDPAHLVARINLGFALMFAGDLPRARVETVRARQAAAGQPRWEGSAIYNLGRISELEGKLDEAKRHYRESLAMRPHRVVAERLANLDSPAERAADAALLAILEDPAPDVLGERSGIVPVKTLPLAIKRLGLGDATIISRLPPDGTGAAALLEVAGKAGAGAGAGADGGVATTRVLLVELGAVVARLNLTSAAAATLERRDFTGDGQVELIIRGKNELRLYSIAARTLTEILALPEDGDGAAYELREVPFGEATDVVAIPFEDAGPSAGRWRYLNDRYRKLEL